jgi:hypothetical protein
MTLSASVPSAALARRMHAEWRRMRRHPAALDRASSWKIVEGRLDDLSQVLDAIGFEQVPTASHETALRALVEIAADDTLAARTVIQRLLPGLLAVTGRRRGQGAETFDELLGAAWIAIRTFNPARRPACVSAALIADADYKAFRQQWRRASSSERPVDCDHLDQLEAGTDITPEEELAAVLGEAAAGGLGRDDLDLLRRLAQATPTSELAAEGDVTARTIRNRRDRATERLRQIVLAA